MRNRSSTLLAKTISRMVLFLKPTKMDTLISSGMKNTLVEALAGVKNLVVINDKPLRFLSCLTSMTSKSLSNRIF